MFRDYRNCCFWSLNFGSGTSPSPANTNKFLVKGTVVEEKTREPLVGVMISLKNSTGESIETVTRSDGFYDLRCKPGVYTLTASFEGYRTYVKQVTVEKADLEADVPMLLLPVVPPQQSNATTFTGRVTDAKTGLPLGRVNVKLGTHSATTGTDGVYSVNADVGKYTLNVSLWGYKTEAIPVEASEKKAYFIDVSITPIPTIKVTADPSSLNTASGRMSTIKITVEKTDQTPASGVTIRFTNMTEDMPAKFDSQTVVTDAFGTATTKWTALVEPIGIDEHTWVCIITASANVEGWQVEGMTYVTVIQPCAH